MSQTVVDDEPTQVYEGKIEDRSSRIISRLASELIYFGKAVSLLAVTDLAVGGAGQQSVKLPAAAADITGLFEGVAIADPSIESDPVTNNFGSFPDETSVPVMRQGRIWVVVATAITDITVGVYVLFQNPGGTPPVDTLGSFDSVAGADVQITTAGVWRGAAAVGAVNFGLLELNLP